jgi:hypothetical protein
MLNLLKECISFLLIESRIDDVKKQFPNINIDYLSENDPSGKNKYLLWMAKQVKNNIHKMSIERKVVEAVQNFHKLSHLLHKKDLNAYSTLEELTTALQLAPELSKTAAKKKEKHEGAELIYSDENANVYFIKNKNACMQYGSGTKWCITSAEENHWEDYTDKGVLFYYIIRKKPQLNRFDKVAVAIIQSSDYDNYDRDNIEFYDAVDNKIEIYDLDEIFLDVKTKIKAFNKINSDAQKRETPLDIFKKEYGHKGDDVEFLINLPDGTYNSETFAFIDDIMDNLNKDDLEKIADKAHDEHIVGAAIKTLKTYGGNPEDYD